MTPDAVVRIKTVDEISKVLRTASVVIGTSTGMYFVSKIVHDLAGKITTADIGAKILGRIELSEGLAYALAVVCVGYGYKTTKSNQDMAKRLKRLSLVEGTIDPNRSSSHLTDTGSPPKEDEDNEFS